MWGRGTWSGGGQRGARERKGDYIAVSGVGDGKRWVGGVGAGCSEKGAGRMGEGVGVVAAGGLSLGVRVSG